MKSIYTLRLKTHLHIIIPSMHQSPNWHLPFRLSNKFHTHFSTPSPVYSLSPFHHILLYFKLLFGEDNTLWITKVFMCRFLHPPVIVSRLLVFSKIPFSNTSHLVSPKVRVREEVSHPHKITIKICFLWDCDDLPPWWRQQVTFKQLVHIIQTTWHHTSEESNFMVISERPQSIR
jgi:hypothetical protein